MATKKLRSMTFPGLTDNYTVPQKETDLEDFDTFTGSAIAIVSNGDTHVLIPKDMYVYIHDHSTLSNGLYQNISGADIAANATLSSSNVELTSSGGLNQLKTSLSSLNDGLVIPQTGDTCTWSGGIKRGSYIHLTGNSSSSLPDGYYQALVPIQETAQFTTSNLSRRYQGTGALNALSAMFQATAASNFSLMRIGNAVLCSMSNGTISTNSDGFVVDNNQVAYIPEGYRPLTTFNIRETYGDERLTFQTDGKIYLPNKISATGVTIRTGTMWLTNNEIPS